MKKWFVKHNICGSAFSNKAELAKEYHEHVFDSANGITKYTWLQYLEDGTRKCTTETVTLICECGAQRNYDNDMPHMQGSTKSTMPVQS